MAHVGDKCDVCQRHDLLPLRSVKKRLSVSNSGGTGASGVCADVNATSIRHPSIPITHRCDLCSLRCCTEHIPPAAHDCKGTGAFPFLCVCVQSSVRSFDRLV